MIKLIVASSKQKASKKAAQIIIELLNKKPNCVLGLATGQSPILTYQELIQDHLKNKRSYSNVTTFNLDEYVGVNVNNKISYHYYMKTNLFDYLDIKKENTFIPQGDSNYLEYANKYDDLIALKNGIDLQILGLGENGHIGFNEPGSNPNSKTRVVNLTKSTIKANSRFFNSIEDVPKQAISMGIKSILSAKKILLLAFGSKKANAIKELFKAQKLKKPNINVPCTYLINHENVVVILDLKAAALLKEI